MKSIKCQQNAKFAHLPMEPNGPIFTYLTSYISTLINDTQTLACTFRALFTKMIHFGLNRTPYIWLTANWTELDSTLGVATLNRCCAKFGLLHRIRLPVVCTHTKQALWVLLFLFINTYILFHSIWIKAESWTRSIQHTMGYLTRLSAGFSDYMNLTSFSSS